MQARPATSPPLWVGSDALARAESTNSSDFGLVALAEAIEAHEKWLAEQRKQASQFGGGGNVSTTEGAGKVRDIVAQKVGLGSGKTLEAAQKVIERDIPELVATSEHYALRMRDPMRVLIASRRLRTAYCSEKARKFSQDANFSGGVFTL